MDTVQQKILEQINFNLQSISLYIEKLSREEIKLDSNKIQLIDYSIYEWLNILENEELKKILEEYNQQSLNDIMNNNFVEYCRKIYLQIEILVNTFIIQKYGYNNIQDNNYTKIRRLQDFFYLVRGGEENFKKSKYKDKEYKTITHIMDIRDIASHTDYNGKSLAERVDLKGKSIKIKLQKLKNNISKEEIQGIFSEFVLYKNGVSIRGRLEEGYAYIQLFNLKDTYFNSQLVINYISTNYSILRHRLGNFEYDLDNDQPLNELKAFFEQQDYQKIKYTMNWFIQEIGNHLN
ncbi:hypothetical protein Cylst_1133 [Cylindrospermum stagnale PCC 7417]|uniref:Uncharacterized protein n=1 Tax=Cylindrospermum stagnale PCC 7417 TaxID=56107 RepID=K9WUF5_9NOST|nr:hypothetical protein [Cylindrospermum stagnale]AFZ23439.1 hypothetical protein Cylst_1133 [Cylindrospermum stagnale PCC 7417]